MKIAAVWIENHFNILNQGFNFGSILKYSFSFNDIKKELSVVVNRNADYFDLYEGSDIINISGVLGENGAGKTSLLKLFNVMASNSPIPYNAVLVFENLLAGEIQIIRYKGNDVFGDRKRISIGAVFGEPGLESIVSNVKYDFRNPFFDMEVIHYSNMITGQNGKYLRGENLKDHSVNYQLLDSMAPTELTGLLKQLEDNIKNKVIHAEEYFNPLRLYYSQRQDRIIKFLADMKEESYLYAAGIKFSRTISVWFNENILKEYDRINGASENRFDRMIEFYHLAKKRLDAETDTKVKFKNALVLHYFIFIIYNGYAGEDPDKELTVLIAQIKEGSAFFSVLGEIIQDLGGSESSKAIQQISHLLQSMDFMLQKTEITEKTDFFSKGIYELSIDKNLWRFLREINSIPDFKGESVLTIDINPFSAGQDAVINQFSEFYEALKNSRRENILITVDEGELYLHPEWQRQYVNGLYTFFNHFSTKFKKKIQLLITSHSPFIASDIPRFNLLFLKNEAGYSKVSNNESHKHTLGGNIFTLFKDSFYLKEFIGEFAFHKINQAIYYINGEPSQFKSIEDVEKFVNLIGEPLIREQLQKMMFFKKNSSSESSFELDEL